MKRRQFIAGTAAAGLLGAALLRPEDRGDGAHAPYFAQLQQALHQAGIAKPTMLIDLDRLDHNIAQMQQWLAPGMGYRAVAKSLPSLTLLDYVGRQTNSKRLMVFHQPFLNQIATALPDADLLLGKPMPVAAAQRYYQLHQGRFDPARQLQWLIDSPARLLEYAELARGLDSTLQVNLEIDVGLHRGGFQGSADFAEALRLLARTPQLQFSGLMGYEPQVAAAPAVLGLQRREFAAATAKYSEFLVQLRNAGLDRQGNCYNAAGSPTFRFWKPVTGIANELSVGTGLLKPSDYDITSLDSHRPAAFIATPVLKAQAGMQLPVLPAAGKAQALWDPNRAQSFFIYGGYWKAEPVSPAGLKSNALYGRSTNQELLNGSARVKLQVGDSVFLRPTQSEFVLLQFGDLAAVRGGKIVDFWPVLG